MPRYINEDEFVAWVKQHWCSDCNNDNGLRCRACWLDDAIDIVEEAPEADVAPRSEVAREIFEWIEELAKIYTFPVVKSGAVEIAKEPFWCIEPSDLAELKKKYTEDKA